MPTPSGHPPPLSPFRCSEASLRVLATDLERDNWKIPLNLGGSDNAVARRPPSLSSSLVSSPMSCSPSRKFSPLLPSSSSPPLIPLSSSSPPSYSSYPISSPLLPSNHFSPLLSPLSHQFASAGGSPLGTPRSIRECEDHLRESRKENFRLRMRIFFLEERLAGKSGTKQESDVGNLKREAETRLQLLVEATDALEAQEKRVEDERRAAALALEQHKCREAELQESLDQQERREEKLRERIQELEEEKEELKRRGTKKEKRKEEEGGGLRGEKDEKGKECAEDTERMLLAVLRELEGIPSVNEDTRQQCTSSPTSSSSSSTVAILSRDLEEARCEVRSLRKEIEKRETRSRIQEEQLRAARMVNKLSGVLRSGRRGRRDQGSNTSSSTPLDTVQRLEEELVFKDQELVELRKELNVRELKIQQLQEVGDEKRGFALHGVKGGGEGGRGVCGETSDAWSGPDTTVSLQRLGLPRHLLVPGSREESTTEMDDEEQEETEREEEEEEDLELTFLCNPQVLQLKEEVEEGRRRLKECKALIQKLSVDNLRMTGRELSFRSQLEAATKRGANASSFQETEVTRRGNPSSEAAIRRGSSSTSAVKEDPGAGRT